MGSAHGSGATLYLVATDGRPTASKESEDNPAIALLTVVGQTPPADVAINEMTTVASVWTHNQFIEGAAIKGEPLQLKIAAGNVPSFVDLTTGGWGTAIQDPLNSGQTPTMANFATLADALAGCTARVVPHACEKLYAAAAGPEGTPSPTNTLAAAESIAKYPWYQPVRVHALLATFYPIGPGKTMRPVPYMPYLNFAPSAWVLPLKFDGGGYRAGGKAMFDSRGNLWVGDNFTVGWQGKMHCGREMRRNSIPTASRYRRSRRGSPVAACRAAHLARRSTPRTTPGFRAMGASQLQCSTRTARH
jgi:hypothetical protein